MNMFLFASRKSTATIFQIHIELSGNTAIRMTFNHPITMGKDRLYNLIKLSLTFICCKAVFQTNKKITTNLPLK